MLFLDKNSQYANDPLSKLTVSWLSQDIWIQQLCRSDANKKCWIHQQKSHQYRPQFDHSDITDLSNSLLADCVGHFGKKPMPISPVITHTRGSPLLVLVFTVPYIELHALCSTLLGQAIWKAYYSKTKLHNNYCRFYTNSFCNEFVLFNQGSQFYAEKSFKLKY